jgi:uncharacterized Tic20 family protein
MSSPEQPHQQAVPAGWYPDPQNPSQQRYWDGSRWTENSQPASGQGPSMQKQDPLGGGGQQQQQGFAGQQQGFAGQQQGVAGQPAYGQQGGFPAGATSSDARTWALIAHLSGILVGFIGPLIVYLVKKDEDPWLRDQSAEALNFQLTLLIGYVISVVLMFVLIGFITFFLVWAFGIVFMIMAAVAVNRGETYRYPINIRMIS